MALQESRERPTRNRPVGSRHNTPCGRFPANNRAVFARMRSGDWKTPDKRRSGGHREETSGRVSISLPLYFFLKNVFCPNPCVGTPIRFRDILQYACGLKRVSALILRQNPIFEIPCGTAFWIAYFTSVRNASRVFTSNTLKIFMERSLGAIFFIIPARTFPGPSSAKT